MNFPLRSSIRLILFLPAIIFIASCDKFQGDQTIPSYIHIDNFTITTNMSQGSSSSKISDVWIDVDYDLVGAFQMPSTFPVLKSGRQLVSLWAGIKMNGIASSRIRYPFFQPDTMYVDLSEGKIINLSPSTTYYPSTVFVWMENFEQGGISMEKTAKSDTNMIRISDPQLVFEGGFSGAVYLDDAHPLVEVSTIDAWSLPRDGTPVFLEMNYKTNNLFTVGVYGINSSTIIQQPVIVLNHFDTWNKIYINLTPTVDGMTSAAEYKIFIGATKEDGVAQPAIYIDNMKLVRF
jgi:hypothetical protein